MTPEAGIPRSAEVASKPARRELLAIAAVLCLGALGILVLFRLNTKEDRRLKWITQTEWTRATQAGPLMRLKWKAVRVLGPRGRIFTTNKNQIRIEVKLIPLPPERASQAGLGPAVATNIDGSIAWVMPHEELSPFQHTLMSNRPFQLMGAPRIITFDGGQASLYQGSSVRVGGTSIPCGLTVDVLPETVGGAIRLLLSVSSIDQKAQPPEGNGMLTTNISVVCQSFIPNNGGLVMAGREIKPGDGSVYWVIVHVVAVDAKGKPLKL